jgi:hypothetical protein
LIERFQNSICQSPLKSVRRWPRYSVGAPPVVRSIQSNGRAMSDESSSENVFDALAADICPASDQPSTTTATAASIGRTPRVRTRGRAITTSESTSIPTSTWRARSGVQAYARFAAWSSEKPGASE